MKLIDVQEVVEHAEVNGESRDFIRKLIDYLEDAPAIQPKLIKYFDEDEKVWTVGAVVAVIRSKVE